MDPVPTANDIGITLGLLLAGVLLTAVVELLRRPVVRPRHARP